KMRRQGKKVKLGAKDTKAMPAPMPKYTRTPKRLCRSWLVEPSIGQPASHGASAPRRNEAGSDHRSQNPSRLMPRTCASGRAQTKNAERRTAVARKPPYVSVRAQAVPVALYSLTKFESCE